MKPFIATSAVVAIATFAYVGFLNADTRVQTVESDAVGAALVEVVLPDTLSENAQLGKRAYDAICAACHGANAAGQDGVAPPLVHVIYEPGHHGDESFQRAAALGVPSHHWPFGDMPALDGVTRGDVAMIVEYVRTLQRANGIN
ncbi:Cytochrome c [Yoonia tamlensis]|uniref:Cytochrome c n=1 Tax=Yoonia tamlensis TaxID=390270 RepID=A0A1I6GT75_9RHOB|nr:cytochrome c [Yoonia tamlensis]SFR45247.1 Cytochrome c [Yoonia tamlensis]